MIERSNGTARGTTSLQKNLNRKEKRKAKKNETLLEKSYKRNVAEGLQNLKCRKQSKATTSTTVRRDI